MQLLPWRVLKNLRETLGQLREEVVRAESRLRELETRLVESSESMLRQVADDREVRLREVQKEIIDFAVLRGDEIQAAVNNLLLRRSQELYDNIIQVLDVRISDLEIHQKEFVSRITDEVTELRRAISVVTMGVNHRDQSLTTVSRDSTIDDALYVLFEDAFRGEQAVIRDRQASYVDLVKSHASGRGPVVDIGPGRGEWLELLRDEGVTALGIDSNPVFVSECVSKNLDVTEGRIPQCLDTFADGSVGAITLFQVAEHLNFAELQSTIVSSRRVLADGGLLLIEIPNIETVAVGGASFWIDPTHVRPLHPLVLEFLAKQAGFSRTTRVYSDDLLQEPQLDSLDPAVRSYLRQVGRMVAGPGDVAICSVA